MREALVLRRGCWGWAGGPCAEAGRLIKRPFHLADSDLGFETLELMAIGWLNFAAFRRGKHGGLYIFWAFSVVVKVPEFERSLRSLCGQRGMKPEEFDAILNDARCSM